MNLQDLRDELSTRAADADQHPADLFPGVQQKIRRTKRRRTVTVLGAAAAVALAATIVPGALSSSEPDPARTPSYTQNGFTLPGDLDGDALLKGWVGEAGANHVEFDWTPTTKHVRFDGRCKSDSEAMLWVRVNGFTVDSRPCAKDNGPIQNAGVSDESALWADAPIGKTAKVTLDLVSLNGRPAQDTKQQLAVGIYNYQSPRSSAWGPSRPGDYVRDGLRFRQQAGTADRLAAVIGDRGVNEVTTSFVPTSHSVVVQTLGTPDDYVLNPPEYRIQVRFGDGSSVNGYSGYGDESQQNSAAALQLTAPVGQRVTVTARLVNANGKEVSVPKARIGVAIYDPGPQVTQDGIDFDREKESDGTTYRFVRAVVVPATQGRVQLTTPVGKPFLWSFGSVGIGPDVWTRWDGLTAHQDGPMSGGFRWTTEDPQTTPGTVAFYVNAGKPTTGKLAIALYEP
ncbi:MAG TPA: hypothetical protein VGL05_02610 [Kribbella sp.]